LIDRHVWHDLGDFAHPGGGAAGDGAADLHVSIYAGDVAGASTVDFSCLLLVPVPTDARLLTASGAKWWDASLRSAAYDSATESAWAVTDDGGEFGGMRSTLGGWPIAKPGVDTSLVLLTRVASDAAGVGALFDSPTEMAVTVSGHPQWLYLPSEE